MPLHIAGILLCAGQSRRFGPRNKLTETLDNGITVAVAALRALRPAVDQVYAIVTAEKGLLAQQLLAENAKIVVCAEAEQGMGHSLACGIQAAAGSDACLVALADMPFIHPDTIQKLAQRLRQGITLTAPSYHGKQGHPVGFGQPYYADLCHWQGDRGAKSLLQANTTAMHWIPTEDRGVLQDINYPHELILHHA